MLTTVVSLSPLQHMEGFEGSFFEDLRQLEFEEKPQVQGTTSTLEAVSGSTGSADPLAQGIYHDEESVDLSALLAFDDSYSPAAKDGLASGVSPFARSLAQQSGYSDLKPNSTSWPHGGCSEVNVSFSFRNYLPQPPTSGAHSLSMYDVPGVGSNSSVMPVNIDTVQVQTSSSSNGSHQIAPMGMSSHVGTRPAPGKATRMKKKRMPEKGTNEYRMKRDRNNVAVRKSREKSKIRVLETEQRVKELEEENQRLQSKITLLSKELNVLKSLFTSAGVSQPPTLKDQPSAHS